MSQQSKAKQRKILIFYENRDFLFSLKRKKVRFATMPTFTPRNNTTVCFITHRHRIYRLNIIFNKSLHIFGAVVDAIIDLRVKQSPTISKCLQSARTNLQCLTYILIIHPIAHTPAATLAVNAIHSLNELPEARHKLLKGLFLNTDNIICPTSFKQTNY